MTADRFSFVPTTGFVPSSSSSKYTDADFGSMTTTRSKSVPRMSTAPSHSIFPTPARSTEKFATAARSAADNVARTSIDGVHVYPSLVRDGVMFPSLAEIALASS